MNRENGAYQCDRCDWESFFSELEVVISHLEECQWEGIELHWVSISLCPECAKEHHSERAQKILSWEGNDNGQTIRV